MSNETDVRSSFNDLITRSTHISQTSTPRQLLEEWLKKWKFSTDGLDSWFEQLETCPIISLDDKLHVIQTSQLPTGSCEDGPAGLLALTQFDDPIVAWTPDQALALAHACHNFDHLVLLSNKSATSLQKIGLTALNSNDLLLDTALTDESYAEWYQRWQIATCATYFVLQQQSATLKIPQGLSPFWDHLSSLNVPPSDDHTTASSLLKYQTQSGYTLDPLTIASYHYQDDQQVLLQARDPYWTPEQVLSAITQRDNHKTAFDSLQLLRQISNQKPSRYIMKLKRYS